jgi:hypothetical protein
MAGPPGDSCSLEDRNQFFNGSDRQRGRLRPRLRGEVGATEGNKSGDARKDFHPTTASLVGPRRDLHQLQSPAEQGMLRVCDCNFPSANVAM